MQHHITMNCSEERYWINQLEGYARCARHQSGHQAAELENKKFQLLEQGFEPVVIKSLEALLRMRFDPRWKLGSYQKGAIDAMLAYLGEEDNVIPDHVPGIGLLDDAMVIMAVAKRLQRTLAAFCDYENFKTHYAHGRQFTPDDWKRLKAQEVRSNNRVRRLRRVSTSH